MPSSRKASLLWAWLPVCLWLGIIAVESTDSLSSANTGSLLYAIATAIFGHIDHRHFDLFHAVLRKVGHFVGYAVLSLLSFRALARTFKPSSIVLAPRGFLLRCVTASIAFTFLVAAADELHQNFLSSRTGAFHDVLLDTCGAAFIQLVVLLYWRRRGAAINASAAASANTAET